MADETPPNPADAVPPPAPAATEPSSEPSTPAEITSPSLPPRDYSSSPQYLQFTSTPPLIARDRTLPRFFRFVASLLFWGGSAAGLAVIFFRLVVLPRLTVLSTRLTALHTSHQSEYSTFLERLRSLAVSNRLLCPKTAELAGRVKEGEGEMKGEAVQADPAAIDVAVEAVSSPKAEVAPVTVEEKATTTTTEEKAVGTEEKAVEAPDLFEPLRTSLSSLSNEVTSYSKHIERDTEGAPTKLMSSLETLSSYISTQSFYATQAKFMPASSSSRSGSNYQLSNQDAPSMAPPSLPANEAAAQCRSEIRGLKGLLLNRRNFALLDRAWDDSSAEPTSVH